MLFEHFLALFIFALATLKHLLSICHKLTIKPLKKGATMPITETEITFTETDKRVLDLIDRNWKTYSLVCDKIGAFVKSKYINGIKPKKTEWTRFTDYLRTFQEYGQLQRREKQLNKRGNLLKRKIGILGDDPCKRPMPCFYHCVFTGKGKSRNVECILK